MLADGFKGLVDLTLRKLPTQLTLQSFLGALVEKTATNVTVLDYPTEMVSEKGIQRQKERKTNDYLMKRGIWRLRYLLLLVPSSPGQLRHKAIHRRIKRKEWIWKWKIINSKRDWSSAKAMKSKWRYKIVLRLISRDSRVQIATKRTIALRK